MGEFKLIQEDATGEFELPEGFKKKTEELKKEQEVINSELEKVKAEPIVRQQDESTKVFNLREHQMLSKLKELEARKIKTEKELNALLQQKNIKLHDHLRKVTLALVNETKKIAPLEKDLESGFAKISNLKNEMQQLFEQNFDDRKKNSELITEQAKEIEAINVLLKQTTSTLTRDFQQLTLSMDKLYRERASLTERLDEITSEIQAKSLILRNLDEKETKLQMIEASIKSFKDKSANVLELEKTIELSKDEIRRLEEKRENLDSLIRQAETKRVELHASLSRLELSYKELQGQSDSKREEIKRLEGISTEMMEKIEAHKRIEYDLLKTIRSEEVQLANVIGEIKRLEENRTQTLRLDEEARKYCDSKKEFYAREAELYEVQHRERMARLDAEMENKKLVWEKEFKLFTTQKEQELEERLAFLEQRDLEELRQKHSNFQNDIIESFGKVYFKEGFSTLEEKAQEVKKELSSIFEKHFGTLPRWKFW
jgi:DNA repair exonuclease SbcCD ATPase subunit